jgi:hypothetical protein
VEKIIAALEALADEGSFCAQHTLPGSALRIDVKGFGAVKFPLAPGSVKSLIDVAQALNLDIYLALADIQETWDAESEDDDWYSRRHRYSDWDDGEGEDVAEADDEDSGKDANYELRELIDDSIELNHWIDARGKPVRRRDEFVSSGELCWTTATHDFNPFKSEYEGYMGNYGNTLERWYHRAAIVLSPRKKTAGRGKVKRRLR